MEQRKESIQTIFLSLKTLIFNKNNFNLNMVYDRLASII